jgi:hypothetical protein
VLPRERRQKATTTQQIGLESSEVSYIVALAEIEGRLEVFRNENALLFSFSFERLPVQRRQR